MAQACANARFRQLSVCDLSLAAKKKPPQTSGGYSLRIHLVKRSNNILMAQATACEVVSPLRDLIALASSLSISNTADNFVIWSRSSTRLFRFTSLSCPP